MPMSIPRPLIRQLLVLFATLNVIMLFSLSLLSILQRPLHLAYAQQSPSDLISPPPTETFLISFTIPLTPLAT